MGFGDFRGLGVGDIRYCPFWIISFVLWKKKTFLGLISTPRWPGKRQRQQEQDTNNAFLTRRLRDLARAVQLSNQSREEKLIKVSLLSPPLCQVRLSANPKRLLQREVQSLNMVLTVVCLCLATILLDKLNNYSHLSCYQKSLQNSL